MHQFRQWLLLLVRKYAIWYVHLAFVTGFFTAVSFLAFDSTVRIDYCIWTALVTFLLYNCANELQKKISLKSFQNPTLFALLCAVLAGIWLLWPILPALLFFIISCLLTLGYFQALPGFRKPWKSYPGLKPVIISLVFTILCVSIPLVFTGAAPESIARLSLPRIAFFIALATISDQHELSTRTQNQLAFITRLTILLMFSGIVDIWNASDFILHFPVFIAYQVTAFLTWVIALVSRRQTGALFYLLVVDGLMCIPWLLIQW